MKWLLCKVDNLIHRFIPHPECKRLHWDMTYSTSASSTISPAHVYWNYNVKS